MRRILVITGLAITATLAPVTAASASVPQHEICIVTYSTPDASGYSRDICVNW